MVLSDPGAAFVSGAVRCCYGYSKLQEIPWSVLSPVESWRISYEAVWSVLNWLKSSLVLTWLHFVAGSEEQTGIKWVDAGCRSWALCCWFINPLVSVTQAWCLLSAHPPVCPSVLMAVSLTRSCLWLLLQAPNWYQDAAITKIAFPGLRSSELISVTIVVLTPDL